MPAILTHEASFRTILTATIGLTARASGYFRANFATLDDLQSIDRDTFDSVIFNLNNTYRLHETVRDRAYISAAKTTRLLTLRKWVKHAIINGGGDFTDRVVTMDDELVLGHPVPHFHGTRVSFL